MWFAVFYTGHRFMVYTTVLSVFCDSSPRINHGKTECNFVQKGRAPKKRSTIVGFHSAYFGVNTGCVRVT